MNLKKATMALLICSFICLFIALSGCDYTKEYLTQIDYKTLKLKINNKEDFILYISNKSCTHCKNFQPKLQDIINKYQITVYKVDTATLTTNEYEEFTGLISKTGTPTVMFFYGGVESGSGNRIDGDVDENKIISKLKSNDYIK